MPFMWETPGKSNANPFIQSVRASRQIYYANHVGILCLGLRVGYHRWLSKLRNVLLYVTSHHAIIVYLRVLRRVDKLEIPRFRAPTMISY